MPLEQKILNKTEDYEIVPVQPEDAFSIGGESKEISYDFKNITKYEIRIKDFYVDGDFISLSKAPDKIVKPFDSVRFTIKTNPPKNYDMDYEIGLRPRFTGSYEKWIP